MSSTAGRDKIDRVSLLAMEGDPLAFRAWLSLAVRSHSVDSILSWARIAGTAYAIECLRLVWLESWRLTDLASIFDAYCRTRAQAIKGHTAQWGRYIADTYGDAFYASGSVNGNPYLKIRYASPSFNIELGALVFDSGTNILDKRVVHPRMVPMPKQTQGVVCDE